jgi:hypothetical protein
MASGERVKPIESVNSMRLRLVEMESWILEKARRVMMVRIMENQECVIFPVMGKSPSSLSHLSVEMVWSQLQRHVMMERRIMENQECVMLLVQALPHHNLRLVYVVVQFHDLSLLLSQLVLVIKEL